MGNSNTKVVISKKKKQTKIICYISLFVLVVLLFMPLITRTFVKEKEEPKKKDVAIILNCNKADESINSTFVNGVPQSILYKVRGNRVEVNTPDEENNTNDVDNQSMTEAATSEENIVTTTPTPEPITDQNNDSMTPYDIFKSVSIAEYDEVEGVTTMRVDPSYLNSFDRYTPYFSTLDLQESYYNSHGFSCTKTTL